MDPTRPSGGSPRSDLLEEHSNAGDIPGFYLLKKRSETFLNFTIYQASARLPEQIRASYGHRTMAPDLQLF